LESVQVLFEAYPHQVAAVIVEPVAGNMGVVPPLSDFLDGLQQLAHQYEALLIFDEVMTGFRVHPGGAQALYGVQPDLTTLGKVIGGGLPVGAYGGKREIMELVAPAGAMYQAGTLSGNPLAMSAGLATLSLLEERAVWDEMEKRAQQLEEGIALAAQKAGIPIQQTRVGTMFTTFFMEAEPRDWASVKTANRERYAAYFRNMLENGVYLAPSQFEAGFLSILHDEEVINQTIAAVEKKLQGTCVKRLLPHPLLLFSA
jgi:glutamate-1-semialdehyde 2,1-aminomutase